MKKTPPMPVTRFTEGRLHGNGFRVSLKAGRWYLFTWLPAYYLIPPGADLPALCLDCLRASRSPFPKVPADIAGRYGLVEMSEGEFDDAYRGIGNA